jgi:tRNA A37 methylthiotransferase MiaB
VHLHLPKPHDPFIDLVPPAGIKLTPRHYAYLKISEGCNHRCTFCIIPSMRGGLVSRPVADVMLEAENLFKSGVKELLVISQDTSAYGVDVKYRTGFWNGKPVKTRMTDLVGALGELAVQYGAWVRLHYVYPYPEEQFQTLLDFIRIADLDRVGCFAYSPVEGATANELDGALPDEVREDRRARFMELAEELSAERMKRKVGKTLKVLVDELSNEGGVGRTAADAPEIDGVVYIEPAKKASKRYKAGDFVSVKITGADGHDLWGEV